MSLNITADCRAGRLLLALRRGPHTMGLLYELGNFGDVLPTLLKAGLAVKDGDEYRITSAGRAACPFRNPKAATAAQPEVFIMPQGETKLTRQQVLAAIQAAGPYGISRKTLLAKFGCSESNIDNHIMFLNRAKPAVIAKLRPGVVAAIEFADGTPDRPTTPAAVPPAVDIEGVSLAVDHHEVGELPAASLAAQMAQIAPARYAVAFAGDFYPSIEAAIAVAVEEHDPESLKGAVVIACTPVGAIEFRPVFVPAEAF